MMYDSSFVEDLTTGVCPCFMNTSSAKSVAKKPRKAKHIDMMASLSVHCTNLIGSFIHAEKIAKKINFLALVNY